MEFNPCNQVKITPPNNLYPSWQNTVSCASYLDLNIFRDFSWKPHVTRITISPSVFLEKNKCKNLQLRERAYKAIVRPNWNMQNDIHKIEVLQRRALDGSKVIFHHIPVSQTCMGILATTPLSSGVLIQ